MARKQYGTTWWGKQWLNALSGIDYSNRLPRGKTYANKGMAYDIQIKKNTITAKVRGSSRTPYRVKLAIPIFSSSEQNKIIQMVTDNPLLLSQLMNRELPAGLYKECILKNIKIFPRSWRDLNGSCSCPDHAVPCKHMAAVLYLMANEIDKNPFLVFDLHDFDLVKGLENIGYTIGAEQEAAVKPLDAILQEYNYEEEVFEWNELIYNALDFTKVPNCKENLMSIFSDQTVFYPHGKFKDILEKSYSSTAHSVNQLVKKKEELILTDNTKLTEEVEIILDEALDCRVVTLRSITGKTILKYTNVEDFIEWLGTIPANQLMQCSPVVRGIFTAYHYARKLALQSAYVPQLIELDERWYAIRWLPAHLNDEIKAISEDVHQLLPRQLVYYKINKAVKEPTPEDNFNALMSLFLNHFVNAYNPLTSKQSEQEVLQMFFAGTPQQFEEFENKEYPFAIQQWLSRFFITQKDYVPVIQVEENDDEFEIKVAVNDKTKPLEPPIELKDIFSKKKYIKMQMTALRDLAMLIEYFPKLNDLLSTQGKAKLFFNSTEFVNILFKILPTINLFGIQILMPKSLRKLIRPQVSMAIASQEERGVVKKSSIVGIQEMLSFNWQIAVGDRLVSKSEFYGLIKKFKGIVKMNEEYVFFDEKAIQKLIIQLESPPPVDPNQLLQVAITEEYNGAKVQLDKSTRDLMDKLLSSEETETPEKLLATLRPYQERGYAWMYKNSRLGFGSIIADDMGLGKTLQVITTLLRLKEDEELNDKQKAIIIVPTTLLTNWSKEIMKFAPSLKAHVYHGQNRSLEPLAEADILITTYGVARSETTKLNKQKWLCVIIDEAQNIKNPTTKQSKAIKKIKAPVRIAMSGTPVENRLSEYWSIFDFVNKGYLGSLNKFKDDYARPIEIDRDKKKLDHFLKVTSPFIMRRLKTDKSIINDLPDKIEKDDYCVLTKQQTALYQNVIDTTMKMVESADGIKRQGMVLKLITSLKQICNHPKQFLQKGDAEPAYSGKSMFVLDTLQQILDRNEKVLIFTQYREMGNMLIKMIQDEFGIEAPFLHGGTTRNKRDEMVENFQTDRNTKIFILSLKAAGTGLNLTAANNVIHYDLWWNPAVEAQATDRAYRIGQSKKVIVHRLITQGTFEEKINKLIQSKKELADLTVSTGENWIGDLSDADLRELVALE